MRARFRPLMLTVAASIAAGCLHSDPVPARPAAAPFGVIGDIELIAHRDGSSLESSGDRTSEQTGETPGLEAAPTAWGAADNQAAAKTGSVPDSRLRLLVLRRLDDAELSTDGVQVDIDNGRVILRGSVSTRMQRDQIEIAVRSVDSATDIVNRIDITD